MDIKGKIDSLTDKSIWYFAKQETSFDKVFQACLLIDKYSGETVSDVFKIMQNQIMSVLIIVCFLLLNFLAC